jgi:hypothetical protein
LRYERRVQHSVARVQQWSADGRVGVTMMHELTAVGVAIVLLLGACAKKEVGTSTGSISVGGPETGSAGVGTAAGGEVAGAGKVKVSRGGGGVAGGAGGAGGAAGAAGAAGTGFAGSGGAGTGSGVGGMSGGSGGAAGYRM